MKRCPTCGKNIFLPMFRRVFSTNPRPESRQWKCSGCQSVLRLTPESAMKIWMLGLGGILMIILAFNSLGPLFLQLSLPAWTVYAAAFVSILSDFLIASYLLGRIESVS